MSIISYEQCIINLNCYIAEVKQLRNEIKTIKSIADEHEFLLRVYPESSPQKFLDGLQKLVKCHEKKIEDMQYYISKHHSK